MDCVRPAILAVTVPSLTNGRPWGVHEPARPPDLGQLRGHGRDRPAARREHGPDHRNAALLRDWVDAANVTDNQSAIVRLASWAGCLVAMQEGSSRSCS